MENINSITCKNCGNKFHGNYCNICSQSAKTSNITWHELAHNLAHALFHTDKGLIYTIRELIFRPGNSIRDYINGKRICHVNPFLFLILMGSITTLLFTFLHINPPNEEIELVKIESFNSTISHKYFALIGLLFIILLTLTDFVFYFKNKYVFLELLISNTFQAGQIMFFTILILPLFFIQDIILNKYGLKIEMRLFLKVLIIVFLFFTRFQLYDAKGNYGLISKIIIQLIIVSLLYNVVIARIIVNWLG